jgi:urease accessory protein
MLVAETYVGHRSDETVAAELAEGTSGTDGGDRPASGHHRVVLTDTERRRSRVRTETIDGADLGIVVGRELADGDVLRTDAGDLVVVELAAVEALVVDLDGTADAPTAAAAFGHAVGNRHWDMAVRGTAVLFPTTDDRERMERFVREAAPPGAALDYEHVPPTTFDDGGAGHGPAGHSHGPGGEHAGGHGDSPSLTGDDARGHGDDAPLDLRGDGS